jgi:replicative DNA helicase
MPPDSKRPANFEAAADAMGAWRDDILTGKPPTFYPVGTGELGRLEIGPGLVALLGGAPGAGKTAFTMQLAVDALRLTPTLRACVLNVEMPAPVLLDRQLSRLSGVDLTTIRYRRLDATHAKRIDLALTVLDEIGDRLCFVKPPFDLTNVAATADAFGAGLLVLDYLQRIKPPGDHADKRGSVDAMMNYLRQFADAGVAVIALSAVGRTKDKSGRSSYDGDGLNLASFRESSELEFGADDAFILTPEPKTDDVVILRHLKARHTEAKDLELRFDRRLQRFTPLESTETASPRTDGKLQAALQAAWEQTPAAADDDAEGDDR